MNRNQKILLIICLLMNGFLPCCYARASHFFVPHHHGGSPFLTDDPETIPHKHWEFYLFSALDAGLQPPVEEEEESTQPETKSESDSDSEPMSLSLPEPVPVPESGPSMIDVTEVAIPAIEVNYGLFSNFQIHAAIPLFIFYTHQAPSSAGIGDIEVGVKYRFIQETKSMPQVGIFPVAELPMGDVERNLGNGRIWYKLPLWIQKSWGKWQIDTGGGYIINGAPGAKNAPYGGFNVQRDIGEKLMIGAEIFVQGATDVESHSYTIINVGGAYDLKKNFSLLVSLGHTIKGDRHTVGYLGLYWTGPDEKDNDETNEDENDKDKDQKDNKNKKIRTSKPTNRQLLTV